MNIYKSLTLLLLFVLKAHASLDSSQRDEVIYHDLAEKTIFSFDPHETLANSMEGCKNIRANADFICSKLDENVAYELHFFWTTPNVCDRRNENIPDIKVGGAKYGDLFPQYLDALLEVTNNTLECSFSIRFVCDGLTYASNKLWIENLLKKFPSTFKCLDIEEVQQNLLSSMPESASKLIRKFFINTTQGNPVLASDFYRMCGMLYGQRDYQLRLSTTQFCYCDVDTFCCVALPGLENTSILKDCAHPGLEFGGGCTGLFRFLFDYQGMKSRESQLFSIKRRDSDLGINDIIKMCIWNDQAYKAFCLKYFDTIENTALELMHGQWSILDHFNTIYSFVKASENDFKNAFEKYLSYSNESQFLVQDILYLTGPELLLGFKEITVQSGTPPFIGSYTWHPSIMLEVGERNAMGKLMLDGVTPDLMDDFKIEINVYKQRLKDALFTKCFGSDHVFNAQLLKRLRQDYPYNGKIYKSILGEIYELQRKDAIKEQSFEDWKIIILQKEISHYDCYGYPSVMKNIIDGLGKLGIICKELGESNLI